ncbi:terpene synthase family protein [Actinophytocola sediminis]
MPDRFPPAGQCVPIVLAASAVLADLHRWTGTHLPGYDYLPLTGIAFGEAVISPWVPADQLRLPGRIATWAYALDDHIEREITGLDELDEFVGRCESVVRTGEPDTGNPLLACLSTLQPELASQPGYPALSSLWERIFASCLRGHRYDWVVADTRARGGAPPSDVGEYLDHADSSAVAQVHLPRWIAYGGRELPARLDLLVPALTDAGVATRLANDLVTIDRERASGENNVLMYGVSEDWVRAELASRIAAVRDRLAPLVAENFLPAVGVVRLAEWSVGVYARDDMRVLSALSPPAGRNGVPAP